MKKAIKRVWIISGIILVLSLIAEFFILPHKEDEIESQRFFYAIYGFISCVAIVIISKLLGAFLKRNENYYSNRRGES